MIGPSEAVTEVVGAIRGVLGLTRQSRLREQINDTAELYGKVKGHALDSAAADIAEVVKLQTSRLLAAAEPGLRRAWAWGPFAVGLVFTLLSAAGTWALHQYVDRAGWWIWLFIVPVALLALLCLAASLSLLLERKPRADD